MIRAWTEAEIGASEFGRMGTDVLTEFTRVLVDRVRQAAPVDLDPVVASIALVAMIERCNYYVLSNQVQISREAMIDTLATVTHAALFGAVPSPLTRRWVSPGREQPLREVAELVGRATERDRALRQHRDLVGDLERVTHVLLDEQQRRAGVADRGEVAVHLVDDDRREPERELVGDEQARRLHQHAREREHPLLAARERAGDLLAPLAQAGEQLVRTVERRRRPGARTRAGTPAPRFSSTVSDANTDRPSGAWTIPSRAIRYGRSLSMRTPSKSTSPLVGRTSPDATRAIVVLPAPFEPSSASTLPFGDLERHVEDRAERPVARAHVAQLEQRRRPRHTSSPR